MTFTEDHSDSMALLASGRLPQGVSAAPAVDARLPSDSTVLRIFMPPGGFDHHLQQASQMRRSAAEMDAGHSWIRSTTLSLLWLITAIRDQ